MLLEPVAQAQQIRGHRAKGLSFFVLLPLLWEEETSNNRFLVNIQACTAFIHNLHGVPPQERRKKHERNKGRPRDTERWEILPYVLRVRASNRRWCFEVSRSYCWSRSEEHTSELQSPCNLVCRL